MKTLSILLALISAIYSQDTISCIGNSITYGFGLSSPYYESYPAQWQTMLDSNEYQVKNFGVSGTTMLQNGDNPYWNQTAFTNALASNAKHVVVELGTNDAKLYNWYYHQSEFKEHYKSFIDTLRSSLDNPKIYITLAPYSQNPNWGILDTSITLRVNPDILEVGLEKRVNIIDLHSTFNDISFYLADSVHPNAAGATKMAQIINGYFSWEDLIINQNQDTLFAPAGYAYQWYKEELLDGETSGTLLISETGNYQVSVKVESTTDSRLLSQVYTADNLTSMTAKNKLVKNSLKQLNYTLSLDGILGYESAVAEKLNVQIYNLDGSLIHQFEWHKNAGVDYFQLPKSINIQTAKVVLEKI